MPINLPLKQKLTESERKLTDIIKRSHAGEERGDAVAMATLNHHSGSRAAVLFGFFFCIRRFTVRRTHTQVHITQVCLETMYSAFMSSCFMKLFFHLIGRCRNQPCDRSTTRRTVTELQVQSSEITHFNA